MRRQSHVNNLLVSIFVQPCPGPHQHSLSCLLIELNFYLFSWVEYCLFCLQGDLGASNHSGTVGQRAHVPATGAVQACEWVSELQWVSRECIRDTRGVQGNYWRDHEVWGGQQADLFACVCVLICGRQWRRARTQEQLVNWCAPPANTRSVLILAGPGGMDLWQSCLCWCPRFCSSLWEATSEKSHSS